MPTPPSRTGSLAVLGDPCIVQAAVAFRGWVTEEFEKFVEQIRFSRTRSRNRVKASR